MCAAAGWFGDFFLLWLADLNTTHWGERSSGRQVFLCCLRAGSKHTSKCMVNSWLPSVILGIVEQKTVELHNGSHGKTKRFLLKDVCCYILPLNSSLLSVPLSLTETYRKRYYGRLESNPIRIGLVVYARITRVLT